MEAGTHAAADHLATVTAAAEASVAAQRGGMGGDSDGQYRLQVEALRTQMQEVRQRCVAGDARMHARVFWPRPLWHVREHGGVAHSRVCRACLL
eukprot:COSAG01_NODE_2050_length_8556_cov_63.294312_3_plen_94_part_00